MTVSKEAPHPSQPAAGGIWRGSIGLSGRPVTLELRSTAEGLSSFRLGFASERADGAEFPDLLGTEFDLPCPHLQAAVRQMKEYFRGERQKFELFLAPEGGTPFQREVWAAAAHIPFGQTRSYWWIAVRAGNPYATRAVGSALGANPLPLFVPCHRVVRADGHLGGFTPEPRLKALLLAHESGMIEGDLLSPLMGEGE